MSTLTKPNRRLKISLMADKLTSLIRVAQLCVDLANTGANTLNY